MKKGKFSDEQIVAVLRDAEATTAAAAARKHGVSEQFIYRWRAKYAGMGLVSWFFTGQWNMASVKEWTLLHNRMHEESAYG